MPNILFEIEFAALELIMSCKNRTTGLGGITLMNKGFGRLHMLRGQFSFA